MGSKKPVNWKVEADVSTVTVNEQEASLPEASLAVQFTVVVPAGNTQPDGGLQVTVTLEQRSLAGALAGGAGSGPDVDRVRRAMEPAVFGGDRGLAQIAAECDDLLALRPGAALCVARHLIGTRVWPVDLTVEIDARKPLQLLEKGNPYATADKFAARMD